MLLVRKFFQSDKIATFVRYLREPSNLHKKIRFQIFNAIFESTNFFFGFVKSLSTTTPIDQEADQRDEHEHKCPARTLKSDLTEIQSHFCRALERAWSDRRKGNDDY